MTIDDFTTVIEHFYRNIVFMITDKRLLKITVALKKEHSHV